MCQDHHVAHIAMLPAALSGSDGAQFLKQVDGDASDAEEAGSERDSQKGSDSESDTSEQGSYPDALSAAHLEGRLPWG